MKNTIFPTPVKWLCSGSRICTSVVRFKVESPTTRRIRIIVGLMRIELTHIASQANALPLSYNPLGQGWKNRTSAGRVQVANATTTSIPVDLFECCARLRRIELLFKVLETLGLPLAYNPERNSG